MKIAVLAWSPLAADPAWQLDGPSLPIEFAKTRRQGELIPVLCGEPWVQDSAVLWEVSPCADFTLACRDLAAREGVPVGEIGYVKLEGNGARDDRLAALPAGPPRDAVRNRLQQWGYAHQCDAVIWRDSCADLFQHEHTFEVARTDVLTYLRGLTDTAAAAAATYIQRVPIQVWTPLRDVLVDELGGVAPLPIRAIRAADELRFKDWQECRTTIGRLDTIQEDLRKISFSLITGLLTAGAFLNVLGVQTTQAESASATTVRAAVFIAVMVLIAALCSLDIYYQVLISGAAERALDLEVQTTPPIRVTKYLSVNATRSGISYIILALYLALLATAEGLGLIAAGGLQQQPSLPPGLWLVFWCVGVLSPVGSIIVICLAYRSEPRPGLREPQPGLQPVLTGALLPVVTVGIGTFLVTHVHTDSSDVQYWIATAGMVLAIFMQFFWVYAAWRSGLYRQKPSRIWPEGSEKVAT